MQKSESKYEPLCETSEKGEKLFSREELVPVGLEIGRRILEIFGYQKLSSTVFRLRSTADEINAVINGERMPTVELLLAVHSTTGASIDWLVTGKGSKYILDDSWGPVGESHRIPDNIQEKRGMALEHPAR
jgi:hypothetical protein